MLTFYSMVKGQENNTIFWSGKVINSETGEPVSNALIAVYSNTKMYSADIDGIVRLRLQKNDSIRVVVLGYSSETFCINTLQNDSAGYAIMRLQPVSYMLKEVTISARTYKGILNPLIFPKLEDDKPKINLNLPGNVGNRRSNNLPQINLSLNLSKFNNEGKQIRQLNNAQYHQNNITRLKDFISPEAIGLITKLEGEELTKFIIYCNANLIITHNDNGASIFAKIEMIFEKYKRELEL